MTEPPARQTAYWRDLPRLPLGGRGKLLWQGIPGRLTATSKASRLHNKRYRNRVRYPGKGGSPLEKTYRIEGMTCDHCVRAVTQAIEALDGVERALVSLPDKAVVTLDPEKVTDEQIRKAVEEEGYRVA